MKKRKYFVTDKQLRYLMKEGHREEVKDNAMLELLRRRRERKSNITKKFTAWKTK